MHSGNENALTRSGYQLSPVIQSKEITLLAILFSLLANDVELQIKLLEAREGVKFSFQAYDLPTQNMV
ncbi:hypothetical protein OAM01_00565 [bacterium]|nr:hypothetical protein [bacterium]